MESSERADEMIDWKKRRYEMNKKPEQRTQEERVVDITKAQVIADARQIVERAKMRGWIQGGAR